MNQPAEAGWMVKANNVLVSLIMFWYHQRCSSWKKPGFTMTGANSPAATLMEGLIFLSPVELQIRPLDKMYFFDIGYRYNVEICIKWTEVYVIS